MPKPAGVGTRLAVGVRGGVEDGTARVAVADGVGRGGRVGAAGGVGVREGAGVVLFGLAGVPGHDAFSIEFITYLLSVVISLSGGVIFLSRTPLELLRRRNSRAGSPSQAAGETDWRK